ncbi:aldehyde dehydrogenase family protein [Glaciimonas sp. PCH181]|uniref:aldehyde dehydrogenase family protein n=1 Tax=Glaciimonas sp. PCH181 TaxID=2133943 RepID=UPI000D3829E4|nr:aldehyde dehydrogenase family protein [Glaciimonas sp. PCH181]PUA18630.1 aldehyde dehydrogenase [Glaciimonas sp. PCH181]
MHNDTVQHADKVKSHPVFTSFIDGEPSAQTGSAISLVDPGNGNIWAKAYIDSAAIDVAAKSARNAFINPGWRDLTAAQRAGLLRKLGDLIVAHASELGALESLANGKPHAATFAEMRATAQWYHFYASAIETRDSHQRNVSSTVDAFITREALGVVVAITPFNAALSLGSWKLAPALAMGNTIILKPPAEAPGSTIRLAQLALEAGFPKGVVNVVVGDAAVGEKLIAHEDVAMVSFTGSTAAARNIGAQVVGQLKRYVCEAGGKSAHIIFEDADLESAAIAATQGVFSATGQTCVAGSRILIHSSIFQAFLDRYLGLIRKLRLGDPTSPQTHLGPIASRRQLGRIQHLVDEAITQGATVLIGGTSPSMEGDAKNGFWFNPTVLADVTPDMAIWKDEVFGPVAIVHSFDTEEEAIALANNSQYGLAAGFWTRDLHRVRRVSRQLEAGTVWVNTYRAIDMRVPFGGYKQSGIGRENGVEALDEFSQIKSVIIDYAAAKNPFGM